MADAWCGSVTVNMAITCAHPWRCVWNSARCAHGVVDRDDLQITERAPPLDPRGDRAFNCCGS